MIPITIVPTGTANLASVTSALRRVGADVGIAENTTHIRQASFLVLPGVGNFGAAMSALRERGWINALQRKISNGIPTLAICLGMQILFESSEESPGVKGLALLPGRFERFPSGIRTPHVGWNAIEPKGNTRLLKAGDAYFTHSYRLAEMPPDFSGAITNYSSPFISAIEYKNMLACQFHPELSGPWGIDLLRRWLQKGAEPC
jgi:imidazole glycerol-phosphate synthase subunit HisH